MKFLRLMACLAGLTLGYLARFFLSVQTPMDQNSARIPLAFLSDLLPLTDYPQVVAVLDKWIHTLDPFVQSTLQHPDRAILWLGAGMLLFAGAAIPWPQQETVSRHPIFRTTAHRLPLLLWEVGLVLALFQLAWVGMGWEEGAWIPWLWALGIATYLTGMALTSSPTDAPIPLPTDTTEFPTQPEESWPTLLFLLVVAGALLGWQLDRLPLVIGAESAAHGLQALALLTGQTAHLFDFGWADTPLLAYAPAALGMGLTRDLLVGLRLAGVFGGLLTLMATWLLGCELFRRPLRQSQSRSSFLVSVLEDDGRWLALLAVAILMGTQAFMHFGRLPRAMEPVGWGVLGLWALLRGMRTGDRLALALSGLTLGLAGLMEPGGRLFTLLALLWLLGIGLDQVQQKKFRFGSAVQTPLLIWLGGLLVMIAPSLGYWLRDPARWLAPFGDLSRLFASKGQGLLETARILFFTGDLSGPLSGPLLHWLLAPLLALAVGTMLFYPTRRPHWTLLSWLLLFLFAGSGMTGWSQILALLPAIALAVALAMDRLRVTSMAGGGQWLDQLTLFVMGGTILLAGVYGWVGYVTHDTTRNDAASYIGRAILQIPPQRPVVLLSQEEGLLHQPEVRFLTGVSRPPDSPWQARTMQEIPSPLPGTVFLATPDDRALLVELSQRYPGGELTVLRDRAAQPHLYLYWLPGF